jgi:hypothetical protein
MAASAMAGSARAATAPSNAKTTAALRKLKALVDMLLTASPNEKMRLGSMASS